MLPLSKLLTSSIFKKYLMGASGLALLGFVCVHLVGNLTLLLPDGMVFNSYAHHLESMGPLLYLAELGLIGIFLLHILMGVVVWLSAKRARPVGYSMEVTKGGNSKSNLSSRNMLLLGVVIFVFVILHLWHFKYGAHYETDLHGVTVRDLHKLVAEEFQKPWWVLIYVGFMVFLGFHLRHGVWSAIQSLGVMPKRYLNVIYILGSIVGVLLALGFLLLPIWLYINPWGVIK